MPFRLTWVGILFGSLASAAGLFCLWICVHLLSLAFQQEPYKPGDYFPGQIIFTAAGAFMGAIGLFALFMGIRLLTAPSFELSTTPSRRRRIVFGIIALVIGAAGFVYAFVEGHGARAYTPVIVYLAGAYLIWSARRTSSKESTPPL